MLFFQRQIRLLLPALMVLTVVEHCWGFSPAQADPSSRYGTLLAAVAQPSSSTTAGGGKHDDSMTYSPAHSTTTTTGRRAVFRTVSGAASTLMLTIMSGNPQPAIALKERNEALCGTGFFTNIAQYMCTEIGDISDEGRYQPLTNKEEGSMQSLLDKMGMEDIVIVDEAVDEGKRQDTKKDGTNKGLSYNSKPSTR